MNKLWRQSLSHTTFAGYRPQRKTSRTFGTGHLESRHGIRTRSVDCPVIFYDTTTVRVCVQSQPT